MIPALPRKVALQLLIIRTAMLFGLMLLGIATLYVKRGAVTTIGDRSTEIFGYVFIGLAAFALAGMMWIRGRLGAGGSLQRIVTLYIVGYALAEVAALFAAVTWYIGSAREWFIAGLVLMVVAFQILPIRRQA